MEIEISDFTGCKIALFCGDSLLTILRDDKASIPWPNMWELPGGGREGDESPFECVAREVYEENWDLFGLCASCCLYYASFCLWNNRICRVGVFRSFSLYFWLCFRLSKHVFNLYSS